jgi:hypothetical protein
MMMWELIALVQSLVGIALMIFAGKLSLGYNSWTTNLRAQKSYLSPPPTPQMRALNTRIMTWLFRILGFFLLFSSLPALLAFVHLI